MSRTALVALLALALAPASGRAEEVFSFDSTLRIDLHHAGDYRSERYMLDELRLEPPRRGCSR